MATRRWAGVAGLWFAGCMALPTEDQRQQIETQVLEADVEEAYAATLEVVRNHGFVPQHTDRQGQIWLVVAIGGGGAGQMLRSSHHLSASIEPYGKGKTRERITVRPDSRKTNSVSDPKIYIRLFEDIRREIFKRRALHGSH
jgi:hypothetical protein